MEMPPQFLFDRCEFRPHTVTPRLPSELEVAAPGFAADMRKSQECEGLRFAQPPPLAVRRRPTAELDEAGLFRIQFERELLQSFTHFREKPLAVGLLLEAGDNVVGVAHDNDVSAGMASPPLLRPQIEDVVQIDVRQQRRDHSPLHKR